MQYLDKYGNDGLITSVTGDIHTDRFGLETCTTMFKISIDTLYSSLPPINSFNPTFGWLIMERRRVTTTPGFWEVYGEYVGISQDPTDSVYELAIGLSDEPIVTHPKFISDIGGSPSRPLNGAIFLDQEGEITTDDSLGQFAYFQHMFGGQLNIFAGIDSYLAADQVVWRQKYCATTPPNITYQVGYINSPTGLNVSVHGPNWLLTSSTFEQRGRVYFICNEWRNSGRRGWNQSIYTS